ncbi:hypothetical protein [Chelativorans salis]|uniref:Transcriptional regulator n=1 Tax=Chelativorans salis TaxID=2978478 RepID=A0ABT2LS06_9HYPH|nr:hypothetical protein [Chelativorans sp. EGI FJ00035]MCT7377297.1 hypothetical protein [Chelativorans sp. EGI FJ00035]
MADFAAVLRKTIGALKENTPATRAKVYEKARATIDAKLAAVSPPPSPQLVERQKKLLEDAISTVEAEYAEPAATPPEDDLDSVMAELSTPFGLRPYPDADEAEAEPTVEMAAHDREEAAAADHAHATDADGETDEAHHQTSEWPGGGAADVPVDGSESGPDEDVSLPGDEPGRRRRRAGGWGALLLIVVLLGAAAAGAWLYRDDVAQLAGFQSFDQMMARDTDTAPPEEVGDAPEETAQASDEAESPEPAGEEPPAKFTQRLTPEGREVDPGPAGGQPGVGEGTSVAEATQSSAAPGEDSGAGETEGEASLPVGQRAIFYEERTNASQGSADSGAVVWSIVEESPGNNLPPEPAIRAEATVPDKGLQLKMTIRRNVDQSLPASHIMELIFLTPDDFQGGSIDNVLRVAMKRSEQDTGSPLLGIPARIAPGFFLVALSDSRADVETNTLLMRRQNWIDIPIVYTSGRRALITLEKGVPGDRIFTEVLEAWQRGSSG